VWVRRDRDAILQPPKAEMKPSPRVLERVEGDRPAEEGA
jgi:hypothetical protein